MGDGRANRVARWRLGLGGVSALLLLLGLLVCWKGVSLPVTGTLSNIKPTTITFDKEEDRNREVRRDKSQNYTVYTASPPPLYRVFRLYMLPSGLESNLELFENGRQMSREIWKGDVAYPGQYLHLSDQVYFVPSESLNPLSNPDACTFRARYLLRSRYQLGVCLLLLLAGLGVGLAGYPFQPAGCGDGWGGGKNGWVARVLDSSLIILPVASLGPLLSFLGRNAFFYSFGEMGTSLAVLAVGSIVLSVVFAGFWFLIRCFRGRRKTESSGVGVWLPELLEKICWACLTGGAVVLFSGLLAGDVLFPWLPRFSCFLFCASLACGGALVLVLWGGIRSLNALLLSFLVVAGGGFLFSLMGETRGQQVAPPLAVDRSIRFTSQPNIYLFFLESYTGREVMRDVYGVDADPFYRELEKRGFFVRDTCSNQNFTIASAATLMGMRHFDYTKYGVGLLDVKSEVRDMVNGRGFNPVFDILKQNGYRISFLHRDHYIYSRESAGVDRTNLRFDGIQLKHWPLGDVTGFFKASMSTIHKEDPAFFEESKSLIQQSLDRPTFHFIYTGMTHAVYNFNAPLYHSRWKAAYRKLRDDFNPKILDMLDFIEKNDPQALIILIGDHGAKMFGNCLQIDSPDYSEFIESGQGNAETLARDKTSVLFAIKSPVQSDIWATRRISHVNLFRYVFAILSGDDALLEHPEPDVCFSWDGKFIIARDGQPLKEWEPVSPEFFQSPVSE